MNKLKIHTNSPILTNVSEEHILHLGIVDNSIVNLNPSFRDIKNNIGIIEKIQTGCIEIESPNKNIKIHSTTIKNRKVYSLTRKSKIV